MNSRRLFAVVAANLIVLLTIAVLQPQLMVAPGRLMQSHAALAKVEPCVECHRGGEADERSHARGAGDQAERAHQEDQDSDDD